MTKHVWQKQSLQHVPAHIGIPESNYPIHASCDDDVFVFGKIKALHTFIHLEHGLVGI